MKAFAILAAALLCLFAAQAARAQAAAGEWTGTITAGPATSHLIAIHIRKTDAGYGGTMDDVNHGIYDVVLGDIVLSGDALSFKALIPSAPGTYTAKWDAAGRRWVGQWTQSGQSVSLTFAPGTPPPLPTIPGLDGAWDGVLTVGTAQLHLILHVRAGRGGTVAWMDAVDQLAYGLDVQSLRREGDQVSFEQPGLQAAFKGALSADGKSIAGEYTQAGHALPLTWARRAPGAQPAGARRPQTPTKPYPYHEEDVAFDDAAAHVRLAGTLTLPQGAGPFPGVVLVAGSGPNTRNEPLLGHQVFLVLADYLTRHGIAVLRYDKRGTGDSSGDYARATTRDFADDAEAATAWLRTRREIDPSRVGLIGHSEGGLIVPMVAAGDPKVAFIVLMAGPGVDGLDILMEQGRLIAKTMGATDAVIAEGTALRRQMFDIARTEKDPALALAKTKALLNAYAKAHNLPQGSLDAQASVVDNDWFRFFFDYDPAPTLAKVRCPVLALIGSKDLQVPADQNLPPIRAALAHNPDAEVDELPGLNHLFQTAQTGAPGEYARIEETIAPAALEKITTWIRRHVGLPTSG